MSLLEFLREDPECRDLARGAVLAVAPALEDPDPTALIQQLDDWAFALAGRMPLPWNTLRALDALNDFLFQELGFQGDTETYDDPLNALLPAVIRRRKGLPIALSILWIDLARRLGFKAVGVGLPGHFIAAIQSDFGLLCFDPFHQGRPVNDTSGEDLVKRATSGRVRFQPEMLCPTPDRHILIRLVRNLQQRFLHAESWEEALWTSTHLILLEPENPRSFKERAFVHLRRQEPLVALDDLKEALRLSQDPDPEIHAWLLRLNT